MWHNTGQPVRLLMLDARACLPILCVTVYWSWLTLYIALAGIAFFSVISFFGLTLPAMVRLARRIAVGPVRTAVPVWNRRRLA
jgi:intracellular multiplication protein IcmT